MNDVYSHTHHFGAASKIHNRLKNEPLNASNLLAKFRSLFYAYIGNFTKFDIDFRSILIRFNSKE